MDFSRIGVEPSAWSNAGGCHGEESKGKEGKEGKAGSEGDDSACRRRGCRGGRPVLAERQVDVRGRPCAHRQQSRRLQTSRRTRHGDRANAPGARVHGPSHRNILHSVEATRSLWEKTFNTKVEKRAQPISTAHPEIGTSSTGRTSQTRSSTFRGHSKIWSTCLSSAPADPFRVVAAAASSLPPS